MKPTEPAGLRTLPVVWHEDRIHGAVERGLATIKATEPDQPCQIEWLDLACLLDMARAWTREQETAEQENPTVTVDDE